MSIPLIFNLIVAMMGSFLAGVNFVHGRFDWVGIHLLGSVLNASIVLLPTWISEHTQEPPLLAATSITLLAPDITVLQDLQALLAAHAAPAA